MYRALALLFCLLATGCATMVNGRDQTIDVDSYPSGASIDVECGNAPSPAGKTPAKVTVMRAAERCLLTFSRSGYESKTIELTHQTSRSTVLNAAFGVPTAVVLGIAGAIIGAAVNGADTGAEIGVEAGFELGSSGATALDKKGGGMKWEPGRVFVILDPLEPEEPREPEPQDP